MAAAMPARPALATGAVPSGTGPVAERREVGTGMARREIPFIGPCISDRAAVRPASVAITGDAARAAVHLIAHCAPASLAAPGRRRRRTRVAGSTWRVAKKTRNTSKTSA